MRPCWGSLILINEREAIINFLSERSISRSSCGDTLAHSHHQLAHNGGLLSSCLQMMMLAPISDKGRCPSKIYSFVSSRLCLKGLFGFVSDRELTNITELLVR